MISGAQVKQWASEHQRQLQAAYLACAVIVLLVGLCFSWFVHSQSLSTVGLVKSPSDIWLRGPNDTEMSKIDLTFTPNSSDTSKETDAGTEITIKRAFCVKTEDPDVNYELYLSRTTNIAGMQVKLYAAETLNDPTSPEAYVKGFDGNGAPFGWILAGDNLISGNNYSETGNEGYINKLSGQMLADTNHDEQTFDSQLDEDKLQRNASSVYWRKTGLNTGKDSVDNYIIEVTWTETQKETDVLYLIANTVNGVDGN